MRNSNRLLTTILVFLALGAAPASAGSLLSTTVEAGDASARNCIAGVAGGQGVVKRTVDMSAPGAVTARLDAAAGDWDLAVFDAAGRRVAGSTFFGANEVAQGFVLEAGTLTVQACRRSGDARSAKLTVESTAIEARKTEKVSLVRVSVANAARKAELTKLGLDLTEHGRDGFVEVLLRGADDARKLRNAKFIFITEVSDVVAKAVRERTAERSATRVGARALPSGRTGTYRRLADYTQEMKTLVAQNPGLVKPITLPFKTWTGMSVEGIEITTDVNARDGKPVFLQMGVHHAREWPSAEHAMEWAYELVKGYKAGDARVRRLVGSVRTIVVPVVNPEGFNLSRETGQTLGQAGGRPGEGEGNADLAYFLTTEYEYQRKNCRVNNPNGDDPPQGNCAQTPADGARCPNTGLAQFGVDPNRNYGGFWGGPGASPGGPGPTGGDCAQDYRGNGPFSEPETQNIRALVSSRQVTTLITNHTYSNLVLRPPAIRAQGPPVDEPIYKALGDAMASNNAYTSEPSYGLYDTSGGTEDWTYYATGGLGYTFEIGLDGFHPTFSKVVAEYDGSPPAAGAGKGGNREAYFKAMENAANFARHSSVSGTAPDGAVLRLRKSFKTKTSPVIDRAGNEGAVQLFDDTLNTTMQVPGSGRYAWHVNPSTRPITAQGQGRPPTGGSPSPPYTKTATAPVPPCPQYFEGGPGSCPPGTGYRDEPFDVPPNSPTVDNGFANIKLDFESEDMDLEVYETDAGGNATGEPIATSAGSANPEQTNIGPDPKPGRYVARVINYATTPGAQYTLTVTFKPPKSYIAPAKETWTMTCESAETGKVGETLPLLIDRGQAKTVNFGAACGKVVEAGRCVGTRGGVKRISVGGAKLGRKRAFQRRKLRVARRPAGRRKGLDRYCVQGGGTMRVGYPTKRFNRKISRKTRKRYASKAIFIVSNSKRFRIKRIRAGSRVRTLRRRLKGERSFKIGRIRWYTVAGKRSRLIFSTRRGRVREVGLASKKLTRTRRGTVRLLRAWDHRG